VKILYVANRGLGDIVFSLPLFHSLRAAYPGSTIQVPLRKNSGPARMLELVNGVERSPIDAAPDKELSALRRKALAGSTGWQEVRMWDKRLYEEAFAGQHYDLVIIGKRFTISTVNSPKQISMMDLTKDDSHNVDALLGLAKLLNIEQKYDFSVNVVPSSPCLLDTSPILVEKPYVLLNLGASIPEKYWTAKGFSEVGEWCNTQGYAAVLLGSGDERALADRIVIPHMRDLVPQHGINLGLESFVNLARGAAAIVSGDTGLLHLADAVGALGIGLYGPTSPEQYAPYHNKKGVVSTYHTDRRMESISASAVIEILEMQLPAA
jgi:heptosyltransferase III